MSDTPPSRISRATFVKAVAALPVVGGALLNSACQSSKAMGNTGGARPPGPIDPMVPGPDGFALPPLPYPPNALEAAIDTQTMEIHHGRHHAGYVRNLNQALADESNVQGLSAEELLLRLGAVAESKQQSVRDNGGGAVNHTIFWNTMSPDGGGAPTGELAAELAKAFGSVEAFKTEFSAAGRTCFGSGWAWLAMHFNGKLVIYHQPNQDSPYLNGHMPLLGLDVWEHAYYLRYQNRRGDYINNFWKVVNWPAVAERMAQAKAVLGLA